MTRPSPTVLWCLAWMTANTLVWFVVQQEMRFLMAPLFLATAIGVMGAEALADRFRRVGRAAISAVLVVSIGYGVC